ncbi:IS3 family transposase [Pseudoalteromonas sp.]|uniref:IS3 family transposase n=1 Tax=Pseudoalteromonas sp. TaxID=53249 RepID=UPI002624B175|nr:IS3 family transposase [Pseudoalteromonas sp.]MCP4584376.1 IS3 family transposase [Pseudoalteromonas sp.]
MNQTNLCSFFGYSRQGYAKNLKLQQIRMEKHQIAISVVQQIRAEQPRAGTRKMFDDVNHRLLLEGYSPLGRDQLFDVLRNRDMLVKPLKRFTRTTNSYHRFRTHKNLLKKTVQTAPNQAYAADITYLRLPDEFCYLSLLTDVYSRKIVGYHLAKDLKAEGPIKALRMALKQCPNTKGVIHHSDRGIQYCCDAYVKILEKNKIDISMTEENHCYENALAERVNETLKYDLMLGEVLPSYKLARKIVKQAIDIYNQKRKHVSLGYVTPNWKHAA